MSTDVISGFPRGALEHTVSVITGSRPPRWGWGVTSQKRCLPPVTGDEKACLGKGVWIGVPTRPISTY